MNETSAWLTAFTELKRQDEEMCKEYREEVDTLLVFVRDLGSSFECTLLMS
jgi:hypothetical protein